MRLQFLNKIIEIVKENYNGREIVIWGSGNNSEQFVYAFAEANVNISYFVDSDGRKVDNANVFDMKKICNNSKDIYVCVSISKYYREIEDNLLNMGYERNVDFCYLPEQIENAEDYEDCFGNRVIGKLEGVNLILQGEKSLIRVKQGFRANKLTICLGSDAKVEIGENVRVNSDRYDKFSRWRFKDASICKIDKDVTFWGIGLLYCENNSYFHIGMKTTIQNNYLLAICEKTEADIGEDCMISYDFALYTNDAHPIWDVETGECLNDANEKKYRVVMDEHVWIGYRVTLLKNVYIGSGSIVGSGSVVNKKFPNNCSIAGNPAKIVRKNIIWNQKGKLEDVSEKYLQITKVDC